MKLLIVFFSVVIGLSGCNKEVGEDELVNRAAEYIQNNDYKSALIELKNALKLNSNNLKAHQVLAGLYLSRGNVRLAGVEFNKVGQLSGKNELWLPEFIETEVLQGNFLSALSFKLDGLPVGRKVKALAHQAVAQVGLGNISKADEFIKKAEELGVENIALSLAKVRYFLKADQKTEAESLLKNILKKAPKSVDGLLIAGASAEADKQFKSAAELFLKASQIRPIIGEPKARSARAFIYANDLESAKPVVEGLIQFKRESPLANYVKGLYFLKQGNTEKALTWIVKSADSQAPLLEALYLASVLYLDKNELERALQYSKTLLKRRPENVQAILLKANIKLKQKSFEESIALLQNVIAVDNENSVALNILAANYLAKDHFEKALDIYKKITTLLPESTDAKLRYASGLIKVGDLEAAQKQVASVLAISPAYAHAERMLVNLHIRAKQFEEAQALIAKIRKKSPNLALPYVLDGELQVAIGDNKAAFTAKKLACDQEPDNEIACLDFANFSIAEKKYQVALGVYRKFLERKPEGLAAMLGTAKVYAELNNQEEMLKVIKKAIDVHPKKAEPRLLMARYYFSKQQYEKALSFLIVIRNQGNSLDVLRLIIACQIELSKHNDALIYANKLLRLAPNDEKSHFLLSAVYFKNEDYLKATNKLEEVLVINPDNQQYQLLLARSFLKLGRTLRAEKIIKGLSGDIVKLPAVLELKSSIALAKGDQQQAIELAERLYASFPTNQNVLFYAQQNWVSGFQQKAYKILKKWLSQNPSDVWVRSELASLYLLRSHNKKALSLFEKTLIEYPNDLASLNNVAWLLKEENPIRALELAQRLNDLKPDLPSFLDTLSMVELENGKLEAAERHISRAIELDEQPGFVYHKAQIYEAKGDWLKAIKLLSNLLKKPVLFKEEKEAKELLKKLKEGG